jgi:hypothetical protein
MLSSVFLMFIFILLLCAMMVTIINVARTRYILKGGWLQVTKGYGPFLKSDEKFDLTHLLHAEIKQGLTEQLTNNATLILRFAQGHGDKVILRGMARTRDVRMISDGLNNLSRLLRSNPALKGLVG